MNCGSLREGSDRSNRKQDAREHVFSQRHDLETFTIHMFLAKNDAAYSSLESSTSESRLGQNTIPHKGNPDYFQP
jgi:hypothetical protein